MVKYKLSAAYKFVHWGALETFNEKLRLSIFKKIFILNHSEVFDLPIKL